MQKILSLIMVFVLMTGLVGCQKNEPMPAPTPEPPVSESTIAPQPEPNDFTVKLTFLGDMLLACQKDETTAGSFNDYTNKHPKSYFLEKVKSYFESDDFTVANLENVLTDRDLTPIEKDYTPAFWFKAKTANIEILSGSGVDAVLLNNNHTGDYGSTGFNDTVTAVQNAGLKYGSDNSVIYYEKQGFKIGIICTGLWSKWNVTLANRKLNEIKETTDYQIIFFHGGTEKIHAPEELKVNAAHSFIDNGADLVVGSHPHVLQPREIYNGKEIIYSLGNFCYGGHRAPENRTIIYQMELTVNKNDKAVTAEKSDIIPCYVYTQKYNNYQPAPIEDEAIKQKVLDFMDGKVDSPV